MAAIMSNHDSSPYYAVPSPSFTKAKLPFSWPLSLPNPIPYRYRRKLRSKFRTRQSPASTLATLQTSFKPSDTLRSLRNHRWSVWDSQYLVMIILGIFSLSLSPAPGPLVKTGAAILLITALLMPITRQFFLPFLPIATWLVFFFSAQFIPSDWRPPIWVRVLPALENILYGANLSNILSAHKHVVLDLLAWFPYGITHFGAPFVCSGIMFLFAAPGTTPLFARTFGYMNLIGVTIQLLFPCSPPWYENMYGLAPANYSMEGSPAGLARIDQLFGFDMYTSKFTASPLVFGAFPSLHSGNGVLEALFMSYCFPKLRPLFITYVIWLWWATMYLSHHYAVDLVAGALIAASCYYFAKINFMPRRQADKTFRWDYDYTEIGEGPSGGDYEYGLTNMGGRTFTDSDEWTVGSSSSISSGSMSPVDDGQSLWEGETLASQASDTEQVDVVTR